MDGPAGENSTGTKRDASDGKTPVSGDVEKGGTGENRAVWGRQLEFILTMVGYAVGLGNVWRFPYLCYKNGGGAFLVPYLICLILLGIPVFGLEVSFGQFGGRGPISIWGLAPPFKGVGYAAVITTVLVGIYYNIVIAWSLYFLYSSMTSVLPWSLEKCRDCRCLLYGLYSLAGSAGTNATVTTTTTTTVATSTAALGAMGPDCSGFTVNDTLSPSDIFFTEKVLHKSASIAEAGELQTHLVVANFVGWLVVLLVLSKGIQSLGKVVYFTATFPYVLLTIMLIRSVMLEGAVDGIIYYLKPDWSKLADANVWSDAAVQIFFSLSACQGGLIALSSYNKFDNNVLRDSLLVPIINCATSVYAGFVVFSVLGYMAKVRGTSVADVTQGGPGLAFVVYPEAVSQMPLSPLWAILFFLMVVMLGFSTAFSVVETIMTSFIDEFPNKLGGKKRAFIFRVVVVILGFLLGLPMVTEGGSYLLDIVDGYVVGFPTLFVGLFELICVAWIYGHTEFTKDIKAMIKRGPYKYFVVCWIFISPAMLIGVIIFKAYQYVPLTANEKVFFPWWSEMLAWGVVLCPTMFIPGWFYYQTCTGGVWQEIKRLNRPQESWTCRRQLSSEYRAKDSDVSTNPMEEISTITGPELTDTQGYGHKEREYPQGPIKLPRYELDMVGGNENKHPVFTAIQKQGEGGGDGMYEYSPQQQQQHRQIVGGYDNRAYDDASESYTRM